MIWMPGAPSCSRRLLLCIGLGAAACQSEDSVNPADCVTERFEAQSMLRFPTGGTFYLPTLEQEGSCGSLRWSLLDAPEGNSNEVVVGDDQITRFTPVQGGTYRFGVGASDEVVELTTVDALAQPFHNLNYFGSRSAAVVGDELWVTNVYRSTISRVDPQSLAERGEIATGSWPVAVGWSEGMTHAVVVQRGNDTLGFVDVESNLLVDAVWVGDEPSNVVVNAEGTLAFVALATDAAVAVVDLATRAVVARVETVADPLAMALSTDGATLFVASHRSGKPGRFPFEDDPGAEERDITVIDTTDNSVRAEFFDVGTTITGLAVSEDGARLLVATQRNDTEISQVDAQGLSFQNFIVALDADSGAELAAVDLAKQDSSGGYATFPHQMEIADGRIWIATEASDLVLTLDAETLAEVARFDAPGRPRALAVRDGVVWAHGAQSFTVTRIEGDDVRGATVATDPRPADVAAGMAQFTGAGEEAFADRACNSCHTDGLGDTLVWRAGPFPAYFASRSQFWLNGTDRLGWDAYLSNVTNFAFGVSTNVGRRLDTQQTTDLAAYLGSIMAPPPGNGLTRRDGQLSEAGQRGLALYEGKAGCASCHALPLTTNKQLFESAPTEGPADVPALVGAYRHGVWLKHGESRTMRSAVETLLTYSGVSLEAEEVDDLTRYLNEMTDRHFFVLDSAPKANAEHVAIDAPIALTFNVPIWDAPENLERIVLSDASGNAVPHAVSVQGATVTLTPQAPLAADADYTVTVPDSVESLDERSMFAATEVAIRTAQAPGLRLEGEMRWTVQFPSIDFALNDFNYDNLIPTVAEITATPTPSGAELSVDYGGGFVLTVQAAIEGEMLYVPNLVVAVGGSGVDASPLEAMLVDDDGDGVADSAAGTLVFSGPGIYGEDVAWTLARAQPAGDCEPGATGDVPIEVTRNDDGASITWGDEGAIGLYVTAPEAALPAGPGQPVTGGEVFWGLQLEQFPVGFEGPVQYGEVPEAALDATEELGGAGPGAVPLEPGGCYKFSVTTAAFASGSVVVQW